MKRTLPLRPIARALAHCLGAALGCLTMVCSAQSTDLADSPLANVSATASILPNILFIIDDSGSMDRNYMPDHVTTSYCRAASGIQGCREGDPPFYASAFNGLYYNPMVNYAPPKNADGSDKIPVQPSYSTGSPWDKVPYDGYNVQEVNRSINLVTGFTERKWCINTSDLNTCRSAVNASNAYVYPDATYKNPKSVYGAPFYYTVSVEWCSARATTGTTTDKQFGRAGTCQAKKTSTYQYVRYYNWSRTDIVPANNSYPGPNGTTRTYAQEMTNFANWHAWYRTRLQMMKTGASQAFASIRGTPNASDPTDTNYLHARVGFTAISDKTATDGAKFLAINNFDGGATSAQKNTFYTRLFDIDAPFTSTTPLRGALAKAGKIYAGVLGADPIQYSCQRNFTILSTDGYWNTAAEVTGTGANSYGPDKINNTDVGDQDGVVTDPPTRLPPERDAYQVGNTLADVAYYYYHTDLRPANADGSCIRPQCEDNVPPAGTNAAVDDTATHQHMTTFTVGLGVDGALGYTSAYKTSTSGDYFNITQGTANWPDPQPAGAFSLGAEPIERIDDLWHAAVNGRGTYFSARDPESLVAGLTNALGAMRATMGAGAAAATSNLQPTTGDNFIFIANYRTVAWDGDLSAYTISLTTGEISATPAWTAGAQLNSRVSASGDSDTRSIYTGSNSLRAFTWANLTATEQAYFNNAQLSQYADWTADQRSTATGALLVNYLRGHNRYENQDRPADFGTYSRLYRDRENVLGDIVHSQPVYVKQPPYEFLDSGYAAFKATPRAGAVYVAANDGMLHAFASNPGQENWAYVPPMVMKNMYRLADRSYPTNHRFFVDGPIVVSDIYSGGWKTILVGALGHGGRGYYALDVTNPAAPQALWTFSADDNPNVGYTYGSPIITKVGGTWVVLVTSGYNNVPEGGNYPAADGRGYIFVLNAATGALIRTISTGVGTTGQPSGLSQINVKVSDFKRDNTAQKAYGGDLYGNLWRFDLEAGTASRVIALGASQPITTVPEIGEFDGKTVLYFGTGSYLGQSDQDPANPSNPNNTTQAFYAVRDDGSTTVTRADLVAKPLGGTAEVDWNATFGWYSNLGILHERVHLPAQLFLGTIVFATTIPTATACQPGGYSELYFVDYKTGGLVSGSTTLSIRYTSPLVGFTVAEVGDLRIYGTTADGAIPSGPPPSVPVAAGGGGSMSGRRVMWRELLD